MRPVDGLLGEGIGDPGGGDLITTAAALEMVCLFLKENIIPFSISFLLCFGE